MRKWGGTLVKYRLFKGDPMTVSLHSVYYVILSVTHMDINLTRPNMTPVLLSAYQGLLRLNKTWVMIGGCKLISMRQCWIIIPSPLGHVLHLNNCPLFGHYFALAMSWDLYHLNHADKLSTVRLRWRVRQWQDVFFSIGSMWKLTMPEMKVI